jgi:hypothetical protein
MTLKSFSCLLGLSCFVTPAFADLVQSTPFEVPIHGTGFGNVSTLITLQTANGQTSTEAGCIGFGNSTANCGIATDGKIKNSSATQPVPSGVTNAADLRFVFNASEPAGNSITLQGFEISFYGTSSTPLFTAAIAGPLTLTSTQPGVGNSGFVFEISASELAAANAVLANTVAIGAGFSAAGASGGQDTVFLEAANPNLPLVPEPATYCMWGAGLLLTCILGKKLARARDKRYKTDSRS